MTEPTDDKVVGGDDLLKKAKDDYKLCSEAWADNRKYWLEDAKFREPGKGNQWPEEVRRQREKDGRPCVEVDKLNQYVRQVVNDGRQNRPGVKVRPEGDGAHADVADAYEDLIRGICARSNADEAFDTALDHSAGNGYGFYRVITDYAYPGTFNQEICIRRVRNPRSVLLDPYIQAADGSDARFGFVEEDVPKDDYKRKWPDAKYTNWQSDSTRYGEGWLAEKSVRVCEYWYKEETSVLTHLLADGTTCTDEDYKAAVKELGPGQAPQKIMDSREMTDTEVKWCRMSGAEILEEKKWLGRYIPLLLVIGNEQDIDGKVTYSGLIRPAKDAMRLYNYARSAYIETVALAPKAPFIAAAGQVEGHPEWEDLNTGNYSTAVYDPIDVNGTVVAPPARAQSPTVPTGWAQDMQLSNQDIQGSMGMYNSSLGEKSNEKSGKAIMARQREGDTGTFHYPDNLNRSIRYLGRIIVDLAPKVYDSQRVLYLLGEDGTPSTMHVDPDQQQPVQDMGGKKIFNLGIGIYGVDISSGPSYTTKRQEAAEAMMQLVQSAPETMQFAGDLIVKQFDWPYADKLAERYRMMLPPPVQQALQAEEQGQDPKVVAAIAPLQQQLQQNQQQIQAAEQGIHERDQALQELTQKLHAATMDAQQAKAQASINAQQSQVDQYNAETERLKVQAEAAKSPEDKTAIETLRLQYEDSWKKLDAETKVLVATISANQAKETAAISAKQATDSANIAANQADRASQQPVEKPQETQGPDTSQALAVAIEGFTAALAEFRKPRTATMSDGRTVKIQ